MDKIERQKKEVLKALAYKKLEYFTKYTKPDYEMIATQWWEWIHKRIIDKLEAVERGEIKRLMIFIRPRIWKQLADNTPIITSKWWITHWELEQWDYVFNENWEQVKVLWVSEKSKSEYKMIFSNWEEIICHWNHEWILQKNWGKAKQYETKELVNDKLFRNTRNKQEYIYHLPNKKALQFNKQELLIHPYLLGFWLWDWKEKDWVICKQKEKLKLVVNKIKSLWYKVWEPRSHKDYDLDWITIYDLIKDIKKLWLFKNKHIPKEYLYWSIEDRLELLAWLIDSDWTVSIDKRYKKARVSFSNTNKQLIDSVEFIVKSLWYRYNIFMQPAWSKWWKNIVSRKDCYNIAFTPFMSIPTVIKNKKIVERFDKQRRIALTKIEKINEEIYWNCIEVEWWIYLAWKQMIPTHNSELASLRFPTRLLWKDPTKKIVVSSYWSDLATDFWRKAREIVKSPEYKEVFPEFELSKAKAEWGNWETSKWWWLYTVWVWWALTWKWFDIWIIDDVVKDRIEAESPTVQQRAIDWYTSTFYTRRQSQESAIIVMMTRRNINDLAWYLQEEERNWWDKWETLVIPAIDEKWNSIIRPWKWDEWYIEDEKRNVSPKDWAALYQQDPIASQDGIFKRSYFDYFLMSDFEREDGILNKNDLDVWVFIDPAFSSSDKSDDAVINLLWKHKISKNIYQLDLYAWTSAPSQTFINMQVIINKAQMNWYKIKFISVEDVKLNRDQTKFIKDLKMYCLENQINIPIRLYHPKGNKEQRIKDNLEVLMSMNWLKFRWDFENKALIRQMETQFIDFPNGKHDDIIDCLAQWVNVFNHTQLEKKNNWGRQFYNKMSWKYEWPWNAQKNNMYWL